MPPSEALQDDGKDVCGGRRETKEAALSPLPPTLTVQYGRKWHFLPGLCVLFGLVK